MGADLCPSLISFASLMLKPKVYSQVIADLSDGRKRSHWIWFIFPQLAGLGSSARRRLQRRVLTGERSIDFSRAYSITSCFANLEIMARRQRPEFDASCAPDIPRMAGMPPRPMSTDEPFPPRP